MLTIIAWYGSLSEEMIFNHLRFRPITENELSILQSEYPSQQLDKNLFVFERASETKVRFDELSAVPVDKNTIECRSIQITGFQSKQLISGGAHRFTIDQPIPKEDCTLLVPFHTLSELRTISHI